MTIAPRARAAATGRVVLISAAAVLGGFVARIVKSWPNRLWPLVQGTGPEATRARRPASSVTLRPVPTHQ
jgi:hypothetical protein